jgi:hypothetical protein
MRKLLMLGSLMALLVPLASRAQWSLGLRVGYAPAMGDAAKDQALEEGVKSQIPIQVDAAYRITKDVAVGGYFAYGIGQTGSAEGTCDLDGVDCSANVVRLGVQGSYTFNQLKAALVPWAGVGFGYERRSLEASGGGVKQTTCYRGFELLNLQVGGDYKVTEDLAVGPYLQLSLGQYSRSKREDGVLPALSYGGEYGSEIEEKAMHQWVGFGIRGKYDL